jgi:hypothetical protein
VSADDCESYDPHSAGRRECGKDEAFRSRDRPHDPRPLFGRRTRVVPAARLSDTPCRWPSPGGSRSEPANRPGRRDLEEDHWPRTYLPLPWIRYIGSI